MPIFTILGELLPVIGTVGLLGLWLYQQVGIEARSNELRRLAAARSVYQTYQSHNAVFNAIIQVAGDNEKAVNQIRIYQVYNYELGLQAIEQALPQSELEGVPPATSAYDSSSDVAAKMEATQQRLGQLQTSLAKREEVIRKDSNAVRARYLGAYVLLSCASIAGAVVKAIDKLSTPFL